jgi:hypothetical protein
VSYFGCAKVVVFKCPAPYWIIQRTVIILVANEAMFWLAWHFNMTYMVIISYMALIVSHGKQNKSVCGHFD